MCWNWLKAIIALPGMVMVIVPAAILFLTRKTPWAASFARPGEIWFWLGLGFTLTGLLLIRATMTLHLSPGEGTPAPWDPPKKLIIAGPYRYVRNPMISGVFAMLMAETFLLKSTPLGIWFLVFLVGNMVYLPLYEEKALDERFGAEYGEYKANVPRWLPRLRPWEPEV